MPNLVKIKTIVIFGAVVSAMGLFWLSTNPEPVDPYCEMVQIYIDSKGEFGWPDYRGNGECGNERV